MNTHLIYSEKLSSKKTELLFIALALLFLLLFIWGFIVGSVDFLAGLFFFLLCCLSVLLIKLQNPCHPPHIGVSEIFIWHFFLDNTAKQRWRDSTR
jgi:hypothetical protein